MPITLYHVSFNLDEPLHKEFIPRIPDNTINEEDTETARVCFTLGSAPLTIEAKRKAMLQQWTELIQEQKGSGMKVNAWCQ